MITIFFRDEQHIACREIIAEEPWPDSIVWIDLLQPTDMELQMVQERLGISIPDTNEIWKNHILNRLYVENNIAFMNAALITKVRSPYPSTAPVSFILTPKFLLTVHDNDPTSFHNFAKRILKPEYEFKHSYYVMEELCEEMIVRVAHNVEIVVDALDDLSHHIFAADPSEKVRQKTPQLMTDTLKHLGSIADLNSKISVSVHSINRMLLFFRDAVCEDGALDRNIDILLADTNALTVQTGFLADKITFQLDAALGMINVEQNLIIKIFSMVAVFFMPPTLLVSIYGMNFEHMPELKLVWGYPVALFMMVMCAVLPYLYFRRKGLL